jgi:hypothetical protein
MYNYLLILESYCQHFNLPENGGRSDESARESIKTEGQ